MKSLKLFLSIITLALLLSSTLVAQHRHGGGFRPDTLDTVTLSGVVIIDTSDSYNHTLYFLDDDDDGLADYHLNFGPYWYEPDSSSAVRPNAGEEITITGGKTHNNFISAETIIVYEINGELWRDPYFARYNNLGRHNHYMGGHHNGNQHYGFGWNHDSLQTVNLSGTAIVDTTFYMNHYYLDIDNDETPDYFLNFGPFWFEPESGAVRPENNQQIEVEVGLLSNRDVPMALVYKIDGLEWRDSSSIGNHFGGGWFNNNLDNSASYHCTFDTLDRVTISSGWRRGGHGHMGGMLPDSLFCQIFEVYPENMLNADNENIMAAYEFNMYNPDGSNGMMGGGGMRGGHMNFGSSTNYQFHYTDQQLEYYNIAEENLIIKVWDEGTSAWVEKNASFNYETNTVTYSDQDVNNLVIIAEGTATSLNNNEQIPENFELKQNYPNPFNPSTNIEFTVPEKGFYKLTVFNVIGQKIISLISSEINAGNHKVEFNGSELTSGIYFYRLTGKNVNISKKMMMIK